MKPAPGFQFYFATSYGPKWLLFLTFLFAGIICAVIFTNDFNPETKTLLFYTAAGFPFTGILFFLVMFAAWKTNVSKITYEVKGWRELMAQPDLTQQKIWRDLKVEVHLRSNENIADANGILRRSADAANRFDMSHQMGNRKRMQWAIMDSPLTMYGSADRSILNFLIFHLSLLKNVDHVTIEQKGDSYQIEVESDMMS